MATAWMRESTSRTHNSDGDAHVNNIYDTVYLFENAHSNILNYKTLFDLYGLVHSMNLIIIWSMWEYLGYFPAVMEIKFNWP